MAILVTTIIGDKRVGFSCNSTREVRVSGTDLYFDTLVLDFLGLDEGVITSIFPDMDRSSISKDFYKYVSDDLRITGRHNGRGGIRVSTYGRDAYSDMMSVVEKFGVERKHVQLRRYDITLGYMVEDLSEGILFQMSSKDKGNALHVFDLVDSMVDYDRLNGFVNFLEGNGFAIGDGWVDGIIDKTEGMELLVRDKGVGYYVPDNHTFYCTDMSHVAKKDGVNIPPVAKVRKWVNLLKGVCFDPVKMYDGLKKVYGNDSDRGIFGEGELNIAARGLLEVKGLFGKTLPIFGRLVLKRDFVELYEKIHDSAIEEYLIDRLNMVGHDMVMSKEHAQKRSSSRTVVGNKMYNMDAKENKGVLRAKLRKREKIRMKNEVMVEICGNRNWTREGVMAGLFGGNKEMEVLGTLSSDIGNIADSIDFDDIDYEVIAVKDMVNRVYDRSKEYKRQVLNSCVTAAFIGNSGALMKHVSSMSYFYKQKGVGKGTTDNPFMTIGVGELVDDIVGVVFDYVFDDNRAYERSSYLSSVSGNRSLVIDKLEEYLGDSSLIFESMLYMCPSDMSLELRNRYDDFHGIVGTVLGDLLYEIGGKTGMKFNVDAMFGLRDAVIPREKEKVNMDPFKYEIIECGGELFFESDKMPCAFDENDVPRVVIERVFSGKTYEELCVDHETVVVREAR